MRRQHSELHISSSPMYRYEVVGRVVNAKEWWDRVVGPGVYEVPADTYFLDFDIYDHKTGELLDLDATWTDYEDPGQGLSKETAKEYLQEQLGWFNERPSWFNANNPNKLKQELFNPSLKLSTTLSDLTHLDYEGRKQLGQTVQQQLQEIDAQLELWTQLYQVASSHHKQSGATFSSQTPQISAKTVSLTALDRKVAQALLQREPLRKMAQALQEEWEVVEDAVA